MFHQGKILSLANGANVYIIKAKNQSTISPQKESLLVGKQHAGNFQGLLASIDVITQEKIIARWRESAVFKEVKKIVVLGVNVSTDLDRSFNL